jgi:hypothetical protein
MAIGSALLAKDAVVGPDMGGASGDAVDTWDPPVAPHPVRPISDPSATTTTPPKRTGLAFLAITAVTSR